MHHVYFIAGLGADYRAFERIKLENTESHFIAWQRPEETDTMHSYAKKLATQIKHNDCILIGLSFGGMLATEIAAAAHKNDNNINIKKIILISSCKSHNELPVFLRTLGKTGIHRVFPYHFVLQSRSISRIAFSLESNKEELMLKKMMLNTNSIANLKKFIDIILTWQMQLPTPDMIQIHGTKDKLLLPGRIQADFWIKNGGHFMVWNRAEEVNTVINSILKNL